MTLVEAGYAVIGLLERVGYQPSERAERHAGVIQTWRRA